MALKWIQQPNLQTQQKDTKSTIDFVPAAFVRPARMRIEWTRRIQTLQRWRSWRQVEAAVPCRRAADMVICLKRMEEMNGNEAWLMGSLLRSELQTNDYQNQSYGNSHKREVKFLTRVVLDHAGSAAGISWGLTCHLYLSTFITDLGRPAGFRTPRNYTNFMYMCMHLFMQILKLNTSGHSQSHDYFGEHRCMQSVISEFRIRGPDVTSEDQFPDLKVQYSTVVMTNDEINHEPG